MNTSKLDSLLEKHAAEQKALTDKLKATELEKQQALVAKLREIAGSEILEVFSIRHSSLLVSCPA